MKCIVCGKKLKPRWEWQKYCSRECRNYAHYQKWKLKQEQRQNDRTGIFKTIAES